MAMGMTADEIRTLVTDACNKLNEPEVGFRDCQIFEVVLGTYPETYERLRRYLLDVTTCPEEVILCCREILAPKL